VSDPDQQAAAYRRVQELEAAVIKRNAQIKRLRQDIEKARADAARYRERLCSDETIQRLQVENIAKTEKIRAQANRIQELEAELQDAHQEGDELHDIILGES